MSLFITQIKIIGTNYTNYIIAEKEIIKQEPMLKTNALTFPELRILQIQEVLS
jgi:hypothetical protein